jgi:hypothetical protein
MYKMKMNYMLEIITLPQINIKYSMNLVLKDLNITGDSITIFTDGKNELLLILKFILNRLQCI